MIQIIFNKISAAEMAAMPVELQLELLAEFRSLPDDPNDIDVSRFGLVGRENKKLYRHRARDYRLYFELAPEGLIVHRVLHKNTIRDFLFRADLPMAEDDEVGRASAFWELIEEGERADKQS